MIEWQDGDASHPPRVYDDDVALIGRAVELYPHSDYLQNQWLRAVAVVRATARGWLLDEPVVRIRGDGPISGGDR